MSIGYPGGHRGIESVTKKFDLATRYKIADALDERANRAASEGGFGWERAVEALREAAEDARNGRL
jgi:hypothetical protein